MKKIWPDFVDIYKLKKKEVVMILDKINRPTHYKIINYIKWKGGLKFKFVKGEEI